MVGAVAENRVSRTAESREDTQMLGFSRKGASLEAVILRAVDALKQNGALKENDGMIVVS